MITVNAMGDACPIPVIKTKKAIQTLAGADTIEVLVDNEIAVKNVSKTAEAEGGEVSFKELSEGGYKVTIKISAADTHRTNTKDTVGEADEAAAVVQELCMEGSSTCKNTVVVIASDRMGQGNDELGKVLLKGFIFAVTQLDELPRVMLFYNGGAALTCEGSDSLADLKILEEQGVEIMTCGTCLDYYGLKEKLQIGSITNMYSIVETMSGADKVIRP